MKTSRMCFVLAILAGAFPAAAQHPGQQGISISDAWARATAAQSRPSAAYMTIANQGAEDALVSAECPVAARVEIHESRMENGVMKMNEVAPLAIPQGKSVVMKPGGYHVMLMQLRRPLKEGEQIPLTLNFRKAGRIDLQVPVKAAGATPRMQQHGGHGR